MKTNSFLVILSLIVLSLMIVGCRTTAKPDYSSTYQNNQQVKSELSAQGNQVIQPTQQVQPTEKTDKNNGIKDIVYKEYQNSRYSFSIYYPSTFITKLIPTNDDGIILVSPDGSAELTVSGINNVMNETVNSCYDDFLSKNTDIPYKEQHDNWFVASWIEGDEILYTKKVVGTDSINAFLFKYAIKDKEYYDPVVNRLLSSFKTPAISETHDMVLDVDSKYYERVRDLFISRFCIESNEENNIYYALRSCPNDFLYSVFVDRFSEEKNMYEIRLSRYTDTAQNYFYYNWDTNKFYSDGANPEEITRDDSIFFWSIF